MPSHFKLGCWLVLNVYCFRTMTWCFWSKFDHNFLLFLSAILYDRFVWPFYANRTKRDHRAGKRQGPEVLAASSQSEPFRGKILCVCVCKQIVSKSTPTTFQGASELQHIGIAYYIVGCCYVYTTSYKLELLQAPVSCADADLLAVTWITGIVGTQLSSTQHCNAP